MTGPPVSEGRPGPAIAAAHTRDLRLVRLEVNDAAVLVRVFDCESTEPTRRPLQVERTDGRGIALVAMVSADWGTVLHDDGKTVRAAISRA